MLSSYVFNNMGNIMSNLMVHQISTCFMHLQSIFEAYCRTTNFTTMPTISYTMSRKTRLKVLEEDCRSVSQRKRNPEEFSLSWALSKTAFKRKWNTWFFKLKKITFEGFTTVYHFKSNMLHVSKEKELLLRYIQLTKKLI